MSVIMKEQHSTLRSIGKAGLAFVMCSGISIGAANASYAADKYPVSSNAFNKPRDGQQATPTKEEAKHLAALDTLDFDAFNKKDWSALEKVYDKDVVTSYSDLHLINGFSAYLGELKERFAFAPDTRTTKHLISFASGDWTGLLTLSEGTYTQSMPKADTSTVAPTGKPFKVITSTVAHWKNGVIDRQYVFFDNAAIARQIGLAPLVSGLDYGPADIKTLFAPIGQAHLDYVIQKRLFSVDEMDFDVFGLPHLTRLPETHDKNILVMWPDGHVTHDIQQHAQDIKDLFALAPDLVIREHPVRLGTGEWTVMVGIMEGTFSGTMKNPADGRPIAPTGKRFKISMATFSHWTNSLMDSEYLIYDNGAFMKQIGLLQ